MDGWTDGRTDGRLRDFILCPMHMHMHWTDKKKTQSSEAHTFINTLLQMGIKLHDGRLSVGSVQ